MLDSDPMIGLTVTEVSLATLHRFWPSQKTVIFAAQRNMAHCLDSIGRKAEALRLYRAVYAGYVDIAGSTDVNTIMVGNQLTYRLVENRLFTEATQNARDMRRVARRALGEHERESLTAAHALAWALCRGLTGAAPRDDVSEAESLLSEVYKIKKRHLGPVHPDTILVAGQLSRVQEHLARGDDAPP